MKTCDLCYRKSPELAQCGRLALCAGRAHGWDSDPTPTPVERPATKTEERAR